MERVWGERATQHAAEVAYQFWRGAAARGTERGATYAIAAADNAEAAYDHYEVAAFLRIALDLIPENDPKRPRLLARLSFALTWALNGEEALKVAQEAGERIAAAEGSPAAAEFYERIARAMFGAGITRGAWQLAKEGLRSRAKSSRHHVGQPDRDRHQSSRRRRSLQPGNFARLTANSGTVRGAEGTSS